MVGRTQASVIESSLESSFFSSPDTYVHPTAYVGPAVMLGNNVKVGPYSQIIGNVTVGDNTQIYGHVVIGSPAQDLSVRKPLGRVEIGAHSVIREFVTIDAPKADASCTRIGEHNYLMHFAHVGHDVTTGDHVTMTNHVQLAGHAVLEDHVLLMAHAAVHQFCRIGAYTALAPFSGCRQDLPPYSLFAKQPAAFAGLNKIKLRRALFSDAALAGLKQVTALFFQEKLPIALIQERSVSEPWGTSEQVQRFITFIANSRRGVSRSTVRDGDFA